MPSQRRFEGQVLEDLLDHVRADAGPGAQIVAANRVRKGGLGGFFTREYFEVIVDVPDIDITETRTPVATVEAERPAAAGTTRRASRSNRAARAVADANAAAPTTPSSPPPDKGARRVPASILDLAEAVNASERRVPAENVIDLVEDRPPAPPDSARFASILDRITREVESMGHDRYVEDDIEDVEHDQTDYDHTEDDHTEDDDITVTTTPATMPRGPVPDVNASTLTDAFPAPRFVQPPTFEQAPTAPRDAEIAADAMRRPATAARISADLDATDTAAVAVPAITTAMGAVADGAKPATFRTVPRTEAVIERPETALARLGLPARLVPRGASMAQLRGALSESLAELPAVPLIPNANGVVIAVVGVGASAVVLARELSVEYGLDPDRVVLATAEPLGAGIPAWLQICDAGTAEERRRSWRRRPTPTIVAVNLGSGRNGLAWARDILDQLEPTIAWSIVSAGWKTEDVRDWIERLGGIDALALTQLDDTVSPAASLELGVPVGRLNGKHATAVTWAELLTARLQ